MTALLIGDARVSTDEPDLTDQRDGLPGLGDAREIPGLTSDGEVIAGAYRRDDMPTGATYVAGLRAAAEAAGVLVWINGPTDLFLHAQDAASVADEAITRLQALVEAGANSVYPVRIQDNDDLITAVVRSVTVPVNCTAHPVKHDLARFARLGVGRITFGPLLQVALTDAMTDMVSSWRD